MPSQTVVDGGFGGRTGSSGDPNRVAPALSGGSDAATAAIATMPWLIGALVPGSWTHAILNGVGWPPNSTVHVTVINEIARDGSMTVVAREVPEQPTTDEQGNFHQISEFNGNALIRYEELRQYVDKPLWEARCGDVVRQLRLAAP